VQKHHPWFVPITHQCTPKSEWHPWNEAEWNGVCGTEALTFTELGASHDTLHLHGSILESGHETNMVCYD